MKYSYFLCLFMILMVIVPVSAAPVINPVVQSEPFLCRFWLTGWVCGATGTSGTAGGTGSQGIPGINGTGGGDINYFNFSGSNLTTISNITNFFNYTSVFSEMNQTPGEQGIQGIPGQNSTVPGPQGEQGIQGIPGQNSTVPGPQGEQGEQGIPGLANMTPGEQGEPGATGGTGGQVLFFHHEPAEDPAGYEGLYPVPAGSVEDNENVTVKTGNGEVLIDSYVTPVGYPGITTIPAGLWRFRTFHYVNSAPGNTNAVFKVYNRSGTTETLLFTATSEDINSLIVKEYLTSYAQALPYTVLSSDRIVIKVYGQSDHASNIIFHFVYEGSLHTSHVQTPLGMLSELYIRHDGTVNFTGKQSMGGFNLTNVLDPVAAQDAATKNYVDAVNATRTNYNASYWTGTNYNASYLTSTFNATYDAKTNYNASYWTGTNYNASYLDKDGSVALTGNLSIGSKYINNLITGGLGSDAVNKSYVDAVNATGITDHGALTGLPDDDHVRYFDKDGSKALTSMFITRNVNDSYLVLEGGTARPGGGEVFVAGVDTIGSASGGFGVNTINAAKDNYINFMHAAGNTDTPYLNMLNHEIRGVLNPTTAQSAATKNYVDTKQKCGATATVADDGTITHTFGATPTYVLATGSIAAEGIAVTAKNATTATLAIKKYATGLAGTTQTVYWCVG